ncbi:MAG: formate dehydrogenase subunit alpha [Methanomicrobia archaeon]|nr:formate dehydrogenase subunit alpha [Methanomicrobia archaeon]
MKQVHTVCPYCGVGCGLACQVDEERHEIVAVNGVPDHPVSQGFLCVKGKTSHELAKHPDRLTEPLKRAKGTGEFTPVSWDQAITEIAEQLLEIRRIYGPDSIAFFSSSRCTNEENYLVQKLARIVIDTNNIDNCARLCHSTTGVGLSQNLGSGVMTNSINDLEEADCILIFGANSTEAHPLIGKRILNAKKRGAFIVVIDPRRTLTARKADIHLQLRPGTDSALINGFIKTIIDRQLHDSTFIADRTLGFTNLAWTVREYTPELVEEITGVPQDLFLKAALRYGEADKGCICYGMGITQHATGVENTVNLCNLAMLTGNFGRPGTGVNPLRGQNNVQGAGDMGVLPDCYPGYRVITGGTAAEMNEFWGVTTVPSRFGLTSTETMEAIPEKVRALYIIGENVALSHPMLHEIRRLLQQLDLLVVQDIFPTETSCYADYILPAACWIEKDGTFTNTERRIQRIRKVLEPPGNALPDHEIICRLAAALGDHEHFQYATPEEVFAEIRRVVPQYAGVTYERLEPFGLQWPVDEVHPQGCTVLHEHRFSTSDGLGRFYPIYYNPPREKTDELYNFILLTGRTLMDYNTRTMTGRVPSLTRKVRDPRLEIHPWDAEAIHVQEDDPVRIRSRIGEIKARVMITEDIRPGCVFMPFHYKEIPVNYLVIPHLDFLAKIPAFNVTPARVEFDTELAALARDHEELVPDKDNILAAFIYTCMIQLGWSPVVTSLGVDHHTYTFRHRENGQELEIDAQRQGPALDLAFKLRGQATSIQKAFNMEQYVNDSLEIINRDALRHLIRETYHTLSMASNS